MKKIINSNPSLVSNLERALHSIQREKTIENDRNEILNNFLKNISAITTISISLFLLIIFIEYVLQII